VNLFIRVICVICVICGLASASPPRDYATLTMRTVDTKLGFDIDVPDFLTKGATSGNTKLLYASTEDDFAVIVADFGPEQTDVAGRDAIYRSSFQRNGIEIQTESTVTANGRSYVRFICAVPTPAGAGYAEAVIIPVGGEIYVAMVVTPAATVEKRRTAIDRVLQSIKMR